jgi:hypothetical protein
MICLGSNCCHSFCYGVLSKGLEVGFSEGLEIFSDYLGIKGVFFVSSTKGIPSIGTSSSISYILVLSTSMIKSLDSMTSKDSSSSLSENGKSTMSFALMIGSL